MDNEKSIFEQIPLDLLQISNDNVRRREITADIEELAHSISKFGLQQPIVVQKRGEKYDIIIGQRRYLAAKQLRWKSIDARVLREPLDEFDARVASFSENAQRRDLGARDKAEVCSFLLGRLGTVAAVAQHIGVSETTVRKWLGYAAVPEEVKALVEDGRITRPTATRISETVTEDAKALQIAQRIAELRPAPAERRRILDAVEQFPDRSVDVIVEKARDMQYQKEIVFVLPKKWTEAIDLAATQLERDANEIAMEATIDWLERFLNTGSGG